MLEILSWPAATGMTFLPTLVVLSLVTYLPSWLASVDIIALRPACADRRWLLVALTGWMTLQMASVAYARAVVSASRRVTSIIFSIGLP